MADADWVPPSHRLPPCPSYSAFPSFPAYRNLPPRIRVALESQKKQKGCNARYEYSRPKHADIRNSKQHQTLMAFKSLQGTNKRPGLQKKTKHSPKIPHKIKEINRYSDHGWRLDSDRLKASSVPPQLLAITKTKALVDLLKHETQVLSEKTKGESIISKPIDPPTTLPSRHHEHAHNPIYVKHPVKTERRELETWLQKHKVKEPAGKEEKHIAFGRITYPCTLPRKHIVHEDPLRTAMVPKKSLSNFQKKAPRQTVLDNLHVYRTNPLARAMLERRSTIAMASLNATSELKDLE